MNWKLLNTALSQIGTKETVGKLHNPEVLKYFVDIGHSWVKDDETAWCSAFVNWVVYETNSKYQTDFPKSDKLNARSWLNVGHKVSKPEIGDIVVLWRSSRTSWKGHVGIFVRETPNWIYILGGNQGNKVSIQAYRKNRLLEYRRLTTH